MRHWYLLAIVLQMGVFFSPNAAFEPAELARFTSLHRLATIYYSYSTIHSYLREPFTTAAPLTLFNTSRFVANQISVDGGVPPKGISML